MIFRTYAQEPSITECSNFFERHQSDRKKRTFEILSKFNPALAVEVVYKHSSLSREPSTIDELDS